MNTKILKNGIRTVIIPLKGMNAVTMEVFVKIGSKYENSDEQGLSHYLEHMAFKGTNKRPTAKDINNEIDRKGAAYNAGTGHETTSYYIKTISENLEWAADMLSDILFKSNFDISEFEKEKNVIAEEIKMYQDNPMMGISSEFTSFLYNKSNIGCWNIAGTVDGILNMKLDTMLKFRQKYLNPKNIVVVIAGDVDENKANDILVRYFSEFESEMAIELPEVKIILNNENIKSIQKETEQAHFCLGVPSYSAVSKKRYAYKMLDIILSGNTSSRLYQKIREEKALAYYIYSIGESMTEAGYWGVQSGVRKDSLNEAIEIVKREILEITNNVKEEELEMAKEYLMGKTKLMMDKTDFWASYVGSKLLLENKLVDLEKELINYRTVSVKDICDVSNEIFTQDNIKILTVTSIDK